MDKVARLGEQQRVELFRETAATLGMTPAIVEKDFWVSWILGRLYQDADLARLLMFKGGTSLSKVYGLIERFSEDIDLILDWREVTADNPRAARSKSRQAALNQEINEKAREYIAGDLLAMVSRMVAGICTCDIETQDPHVINIRYPGAFDDTYLRPEVRLNPAGSESQSTGTRDLVINVAARCSGELPRPRDSDPLSANHLPMLPNCDSQGAGYP
ncbi:nucleotidyl transferase AbiEii/AbiGii toxin family protein [Sulfuriflexus sp.]|uniref:nucleotidyl transferase AbiEii/AbiGii toxin family protein n=1 Tax=Sulfuriflexus sp. TaxID=2015443 RepID=UPI0028CC46AD|nr:nucleotidyl transferase AbiEii/AbiGii toxin family protein [Sulfuriflexus sp.]MDT8403006.1 nucleotidyl transferase AbiEii/AbiGii toxin family protein [Sulfuriflexus sp.]